MNDEVILIGGPFSGQKHTFYDSNPIVSLIDVPRAFSASGEELACEARQSIRRITYKKFVLKYAHNREIRVAYDTSKGFGVSFLEMAEAAEKYYNLVAQMGHDYVDGMLDQSL